MCILSQFLKSKDVGNKLTIILEEGRDKLGDWD